MPRQNSNHGDAFQQLAKRHQYQYTFTHVLFRRGELTSLVAEAEAEAVDENDDDDDDEVIVTVALAESIVLSRHAGGLRRWDQAAGWFGWSQR